MLIKAYDEYRQLPTSALSEVDLFDLAFYAPALDFSHDRHQSLSEWTREIETTRDIRQCVLLDFCRWVYDDLEKHLKLKRMRRQVAKFWNRWGKEIVQARLLGADIDAQLVDNHGKTWLFQLAQKQRIESKWTRALRHA